MKNLKMCVAAGAAVAAVALTSCGSSSDGDATSTAPASQSVSSASADCAQVMKTTGDPAVVSAAKSAAVPAGVTVDDVYTTHNVDDRSMLDVLVYVCGDSALRGDALKDVATTVAQSIKASSAGTRVATLRVSNAADRNDPAMRVRCDDFQLYTWAPDVETGVARLNWK